jgi:hypothetical protein
MDHLLAGRIAPASLRLVLIGLAGLAALVALQRGGAVLLRKLIVGLLAAAVVVVPLQALVCPATGLPPSFALVIAAVFFLAAALLG